MDRSRLFVALALALSLISVLIGVINISLGSRKSAYTSSTESFLTSGKAGLLVVDIKGVIRDGKSRGGDTGADDIIKELKEAKENPTIRGVILRVNSPGGAVGATKKIYQAIRDLRKVKPIFAVISDMAASGGYYAASACDRIFAFEGSIVGSIGVISFHPDLSELLAKYGIKVSAIKAGKYKDQSYPFRPMTDEEREMHQSAIDDAYQQFLNDVAEGRNQAVTSVRNWAEGKIVSGKKAKAEQMIDDLGGIPEAVEAMKIMIKTTEELPLYYPEKSPFDEFLSGLSSKDQGYSFLIHAPFMYLYPAGFRIPLELIARDL